MFKKFLKYLGIFIIILLFVFRDLILNISTNLLDWRDYPYIIWTMFQSTTHISNLDFVNFFETNAFYPHKLTLMFSDMLLPQAIILLPFLILTKNIILSFNIIFLITFILNFVSLYLFWKQLFKKDVLAFLGSLFFIFSPFFHLELSHFQILSYWPYFLTLYFLFKHEEKSETKNLIFAGLSLTIQFLASVYISVYLMFSILFLYLLKIIVQKQYKPVISRTIVIFFVFLLTSGIFIKGYIDMKNIYNVKRDIKEYITYSAHLSDYLFTSQINSLFHKSPIMQIWNKADKNWSLHSSFPGFLIFILSTYALFRFTKNKQVISINLDLNKEKLFFLSLIIIGFLFSLGPRINFNGNYAHIPLPYTIVLKFIPIAEATRVPSRWSFLFFLGLTYFALLGVSKLGGKFNYNILVITVFILFILEYIPINIRSYSEEYINESDQKLKQICKNDKKVLLKVPVTHLDVAPDIITGLNYISKTQISSTYHNCLLVNGYSGYDLPQIFELKDKINDAIAKKDTQLFLKLIKENNIDIVQFNPNFFIKELKIPGNEFIEILSKEKQLTKIDAKGTIFISKPISN